MLSFSSSEEKKPEKLLKTNLNIIELFSKSSLIYKVLKSHYAEKTQLINNEDRNTNKFTSNED